MTTLINISEWIYPAIYVTYIATILGIIGVVVSENRNPVKSLAWVTVLLLFPILGLTLYIFFGRSLKSKHLISRKNKRKLRRRESYKLLDENQLPLSPESKQEIRLARSLSGSHYFPGNKVKIFTNGKDKFDQLLTDIANAKKCIYIQYYIFNNDNIGNKVCDALIAKAHEGVQIKVIYDHVGSFNVRSRFFKRMRAEGILIEPFLRVTFPLFATRINWRNHRKIVVIDNCIGYIGGMNIADRYVVGTRKGMWRDTHCRITGPFVSSLLLSFAIDWNFLGGELIEIPKVNNDIPVDEDAGMQLMTSGPNDQWSNIASLFLKSISLAKKCVYIQTPYFLPTESILKALQSAALSKVDVRVMIPHRSDSAILTLSSRSYIAECLKAGIKIYFYEPGMLHSKMLIVDDELSTIGSANFDFRSFEHNFESNVFIYSKEVNAETKRIFMDDLKNCNRIISRKWRRRNPLTKFKESVIRLLSPIL